LPRTLHHADGQGRHSPLRRSHRCLEDVDLTVSKGDIVALLGPNGAGKTTLLKAIAGMLPFEQGDVVEGDVLFENVSLARKHLPVFPPGIALVQDGRQCFRELTIGEIFARPPSPMPKARRPAGNGFQLFSISQGYDGPPAGCCPADNCRCSSSEWHHVQSEADAARRASLGLSPVMVQSVFDVIERLHRDIGSPSSLPNRPCRVFSRSPAMCSCSRAAAS